MWHRLYIDACGWSGSSPVCHQSPGYVCRKPRSQYMNNWSELTGTSRPSYIKGVEVGRAQSSVSASRHASCAVRWTTLTAHISRRLMTDRRRSVPFTRINVILCHIIDNGLFSQLADKSLQQCSYLINHRTQGFLPWIYHFRLHAFCLWTKVTRYAATEIENFYWKFSQ